MIPNDLQWGDLSGDFDAQDAFRVFHGLKNEETFTLYRKDILARVQDLRFMPSIPFQYYIQGFAKFVLSRDYGESSPSEVADGYLSVLLSRAVSDSAILLSIWDCVLPAIEYVVKNQDNLGADKEIFGDFSEKLKNIQDLLGV